jgi:hypothetical protein
MTLGAACDSGSDPAGDGETTSGTADDDGGDGDTGADAGDGDGDGDGETTGLPEPIGTVSGTVMDATGAPYASPGGQLCGPVDDEGAVGACRAIMEEADGTWTIELFEEGDYNMKWVNPPEGDTHYSTVIELINVAAGDNVVEQNYVIPQVGATVDLTDAAETEVDMGSGLMVTLDPAVMDWAFLDPIVGGVSVPMDDWRFTEHNGETVVAIWAFAPFGAHPEAEDGKIDFVINDALGLDPDTVVNFYDIDKDNAWIHPAGSGAVSADGTMITPDEGFHYMSQLIVTTP